MISLGILNYFEYFLKISLRKKKLFREWSLFMGGGLGNGRGGWEMGGGGAHEVLPLKIGGLKKAEKGGGVKKVFELKYHV